MYRSALPPSGPIARAQSFASSVLGLALTLALSFASPADAQALEVLPRPAAPFAGKIAPRGDAATPAFPQAAKAPAGAPNIVVVLLDDVGFSASSTFGGLAKTPTLQRLADQGISYNQFHVTALCAPTRAALLTGRNAHQAGFGQVATAGYPGYNSVWQKDTVGVAEVLRQNGYGTAAFGKWHNTPAWEVTPAGPFERWPTSLGFEFFYGFHGGAENQYEPRIWRNTLAVEPDRTAAQGYHLIADMAEQAQGWLRTQDAVYPDKPFFLWFAPGGTHWPQHAPSDWIAKCKGQFDVGWDKLREQNFARQQKLGVIPKDAVLTARPPELPAWDSLSADQQRLLAREAEVAAAFLAFTDHQVGRVLDEIKALGRADNTLVFFIAGDNGAAIDNPLTGRDAQDAQGRPRTLEERLKLIDQLGSNAFDNNYGAGWGWADNTPFQYGKGQPAYLGGIRNPMVVSWPARIQAKGEIRRQFGHAIDIAPTIYEVTGIKFPDVVEGIAQVPLAGQSLAYSFARADAAAPQRVQYFEINGTRGIYQDGWFAGVRHVRKQPGALWSQEPFGDRAWELYNLNTDYSQARNLAAEQPALVKALEALFDQEAQRNEVYPLQPGGEGRPNPSAGRQSFSYRAGVQRIPSGNAPQVAQRAHRISAELQLDGKRSNDGVIIANGGRWGGYSLYVQDGRLHYAANAHGHASGHLVSAAALPAGKVSVAFEFTPDVAQPVANAVAGQGRLFVNGQLAGAGAISKIAVQTYESQDIGADLGSPVTSDYATPFRFGGQIERVQIELR
ncbi:sulfatase-like hydrolase/transferase [Paucibacter sp. TC2R-5]|uniref:sulfatase-like hydrolase/transferase n=1 Tax=Paucibacter sp. TC2R-5 TaxID=2893555 RepID=UPI0021E50EA7|nr:arylsulfatase [Paucibacter sp. TC2R-5]MCV2361255.1 sulfatase-like hydrolase/transferase [Paucibacter sp. TC2R-5]